MSEIIIYILVFAFGIFLGAIFFGGLWLTVKKGLNAKYPAVWFGLSLIIRMAVVLAGFYFVVEKLKDGIPALRLLLCLLGLLLARMLITKRGALGFTLPNEKS